MSLDAWTMNGVKVIAVGDTGDTTDEALGRFLVHTEDGDIEIIRAYIRGEKYSHGDTSGWVDHRGVIRLPADVDNPVLVQMMQEAWKEATGDAD